ncbi:HlyD family efflux transporter periplasmic adaptor subunit [Marivirga tractuosa]|uniref:HlyD family secretion protein n=1 Tax=Marivirga tractuosa TaxID=1006 RepID=UPI0035D0794C
MQEIIGRPPSWIIRWGLSIFFLVLILLLGLSYFISYPDVIRSEFKLSSINSPKIVVAKAEGQLNELHAEDGQYVEKGEILGIIESTSNPKKVFQVSKKLVDFVNALDSNDLDKIDIGNNEIQQLGALQISYQQFYQAVLNFNNYWTSGYFLERRKSLISKINNLKQLKLSLKQQQKILAEDLLLAEEVFVIQGKLYNEDIIDKIRFNQERSKFLNNKLVVERLNASILNNESSLVDLNNQLIELDNTIAEQKGLFRQAINTFQSEIMRWKNQFLIIAPETGYISYTNLIEENQHLNIGEELFYIIPENIKHIGLINISQNNLGKIKIGQNVNIKFSSYPAEEYGVVEGIVDQISNITKDDKYLIKVKLPNELKTNFSREIAYKEGLTAEAEIITRKSRFINKFTYQIRKAFNSR